MFLFLTIWLHFCSIFVHPVYVSITNMDIDVKKGDIAMEVRLFTDELEMVLHNKYNINGWLGTPNEHSDGRRLLCEYVHERFSITVNSGEKIELVTDSMIFRKDEEAIMCFYIKGIAKQSIRRIEIDNRLLTDFFAKQNNLVIINTGRDEIGRKLDRKNHKIELSL